MPRISRSSKDTLVFVRNFIFGIEDSLVSTVGLLSGIASTNVPPRTILLTGAIYIVVEAFSMAVGSFLSEESVGDYAESGGGSFARSFFGGVVMFVSFVAAGFVPLAPYIFISGSYALPVSMGSSIVLLLILGFGMGVATKTKPFRRGARMAVLGGLAIAIGVLVGKFF